MKRNIFLLFFTRKLLLFLFLGLVITGISFGFISKAVEFIIVQRETSRLEGYYRTIGVLEKVAEVEGYSLNDALDLLRSDQEISMIDTRFYSSGVMQGIYNHDYFPGRNESEEYPEDNHDINNQQAWFFGTLSDREEISRKDEYGKEVLGGVTATFQVDEVLAGYPELVSPGFNYGVFVSLRIAPDAQRQIAALREMQIGKRYLLRVYRDIYTPTSNNNPYWKNNLFSFWLMPLDGEALWYLEIPKGSEDLIQDPRYAEMQKAIRLLETNNHSLLIVGTDDMSAMPQVQESQKAMYLTEGRWANRFDQEAGNCVMVISSELAAVRNLALGDRIRLDLRRLREPYYGYIRYAEADAWEGYPSQTQEFEIVGIYQEGKDAGLGLGGYKQNLGSMMAYIPNACLPANLRYDAGVLATDLPINDSSFVLRDPRQQRALREKYQEPLAAMGYGLQYLDNNALNFYASSEPVKASLRSGLILFSLVMVLAALLVVLVYLLQQRRNFGIARALGLPANVAVRQLRSPLLLLAVLGVSIGALAAWNYAAAQAKDTLAILPTPAGVLPSTQLALSWLLGIWVLTLVFLLGLAQFGLAQLKALPVLTLLQQGSALVPPRKSGTVPTIEMDAPASLPLNFAELGLLNPPASGQLEGKALLHFSGKQVGRAGQKSVLALLLALGFVVVLGWLRTNIEQNRVEIEKLYATTHVRADVYLGSFLDNPLYFDEIPAWTWYNQNSATYVLPGFMEKALATNFFERTYLSRLLFLRSRRTDPVKPEFQKVWSQFIYGFNSLEDARRTQLKGVVIEYLPGYDDAIFAKQWTAADLEKGPPPLIVPEDILALHQLKLGDEVTWVDLFYNQQTYQIVGTYSGGACKTISTSFEWRTSVRKVLGSYYCMLTPLSVQDTLYKQKLGYWEVSFYLDPRYGRELEKVKQELRDLIYSPGMTMLPVNLKFWDEELTAAVQPLEKNLSLLEVLYPVSVAVSILIGFGLSLALVLQQARESALLRMLGVGAVPLRLLLSGTQLLLALIGVLLGIGVLALMRRPAGLGPQALAAAGFYLLGVLLGTLIGATLVSRRKPMELLQVKE